MTRPATTLRTLTIALLATCCTLAAGVAIAQEADGADPRAAMREMLQKADSNKDGAIDRGEFAAVRQSRFGEMDRDGDGKVTKAEMEARAAERAAERGGRLFARADADGDGAISKAEFEATEMRMFERMDRNGDGRLSPEDRPGQGRDGQR